MTRRKREWWLPVKSGDGIATWRIPKSEGKRDMICNGERLVSCHVYSFDDEEPFQSIETIPGVPARVDQVTVSGGKTVVFAPDNLIIHLPMRGVQCISDADIKTGIGIEFHCKPIRKQLPGDQDVE